MTDKAFAAPALLEAQNLYKTYGGVHALKGIDFSLRPGSVHVLLGENGAGKSTLIKIFSGAIRPDSGLVTIKGENFYYLTPAQALAAGIATVYQETSLYADLSVMENLFVGRYARNRLGLVNWSVMRDAAIHVFDSLGVALSLTKPVAELGKADAQIVEIARALARNAQILILDEPTAALTESEVDTLLSLARSLASKGTGIIYISHRLDEVFRIADEITVLRDGSVAASASADTVDQNWVVSSMLGREISQVYSQGERLAREEVVLELQNLHSPGLFQDVSISVHAGEIVALVGLLGSGASRVLRTVFGIGRISAGRILLNGREVHPRPWSAARGRIALVPEDRKTEGLFLDMSAQMNLSVADLKAVSKGILVNKARMKLRAESVFKSLSIRPSQPKLTTASFSGGNQQKIVIGKWLSIEPQVLLLEEPTQGIDIGAKVEVHRLMEKLANSGVAILMFSSDLPEVAGMADRILVFRKGHLTEELPKGSGEEQILAAMSAD